MELQGNSTNSIVCIQTGCEIPVDILDDLCSRFIINVPENERKDFIRICFQIELAHWFYLDFYLKEILKDRKACGFKEFAYKIFQHIPYLQPHINNLEAIIDEWKGYKYSVPTFGAILLDENLTHVLLVQSYCSKYSWGFPKGKVNKNETPCHCAVREVYEETGFNIENLIDPKEYIEVQVNEQVVRLYVVPGVSRGEVFAPKTRSEIKAINWFPVTDLPATKKDALTKLKSGVTAHSLYLVTPFIRRLRQWIFEYDKKYVKKYKRPRFKSCGDLDYYSYKSSASFGKDSHQNLEIQKHNKEYESLSLISVEETHQHKNMNVTKTIIHNKNSSFVKVLSSSSQSEFIQKKCPLPLNPIKKYPISFKNISLSEAFIKNGISAFCNFKFDIRSIEVYGSLVKGTDHSLKLLH